MLSRNRRGVPYAAMALLLAPSLVQARAADGGGSTALTPRILAPIRAVPAVGVQAGSEAWAAGPDYKVAFHGDSVAFHPVLGADAPRNLPLAWTTKAISAGGALTAAVPTGSTFSDWRFERSVGQATEVWLVREDGVEQTFVFDAPQGVGDLIVRGSFDSELVADPVVPARHTEIEFRDASGMPVVRYGAARAIDATGRVLDLATGFDGRDVELRVPASWLASATWPVTIDPLLSSSVIATGSQAAISVRIAADEESREFLVAVSRPVSSNDRDVYVYAMGSTLGTGTLVLADQSASFDTQAAVPTYVGGADSWVIALERQPRGLGRPTLVYQVRARRDHSRNDSVRDIPLATNEWPRGIDLGGSSSFAGGRHALLVFQSNTSSSNSDLTDIKAVVIDASTKTHGGTFVVSPDGSSNTRGVDRERPTVQPESTGASEGWIVAWQEISNATFNDDWDLQCVRVFPNGTRSVRSWLGVPADSVHGVTPRIAGRDGEYLVAFGEIPNLAQRPEDPDAPILRVQRFQWKTSQTTPVQGAVRTLAVGSNAYRVLGAAFDTRTASHWGVVWQDGVSEFRISRIGNDGLIAESALLTAGTPHGTAAGVTYDLNDRNFVVAYGTDQSPFPVLAQRLAYPAGAMVLLYGQGCGGSEVVIDPPYAGHGSFTLGMNGLPGSAPAVLLLGALHTAVRLDALGMTGCVLLVDLGAPSLFLPVAVSSSGQARPELALPSTLRGDLRLQFAWVAPAANPAGVAAGRGFLVQVR